MDLHRRAVEHHRQKAEGAAGPAGSAGTRVGHGQLGLDRGPDEGHPVGRGWARPRCGWRPPARRRRRSPGAARPAAWSATGAGPWASSRSTMASTRAATRAWNCTRPSVAAMTSRFEELADRLHQLARRWARRAGRAGVGGARAAATAWARRRPAGAADQAEQVVLVLAHPPSDGRQLDRSAGPRQVTRGLQHADRAPTQGAQRLPPAQVIAGRRWSRRLARRRRSARRRCPHRPPAGREPKRQARTHNQPRSSTGSPRWASSQSSTAASPWSSTMRLPSRKSPCTTPGSTAEVGGRPASAARARRPDGAGPARRAGRGAGRTGSSARR